MHDVDALDDGPAHRPVRPRETPDHDSGDLEPPATVATLGEVAGGLHTGHVDSRAFRSVTLALQRTAGNRAVAGVAPPRSGRRSCCAGPGARCPRCSEEAIELDDGSPPVVARDMAGADARGHDEGARPLPSGTRAEMESAFGRDFAGVRLLTGAGAARSAAHLGADAFTVGSDITFGAGRYQPGTAVGDALLAHELAHVVQQGGRTPDRDERRRLVDDPQAEADADAATAQFLVGERRPPTQRPAGLGIHRCVMTGGGISPSAFQFERITGGGDPDDRSLPWYAACVNFTITHVGAAPRMSMCQFEVGFPGIHRLGRTSTAEAQVVAAEAFNTVVPALLKTRTATCATIKVRVQSYMNARIPGVRVNSPCVTSILTPTEWPTRH